MYKSDYSASAYEAYQDHISVLRRHNDYLQSQLDKARKEISDRDMRAIMIMSWIIVVVKLYPYL